MPNQRRSTILFVIVLSLAAVACRPEPVERGPFFFARHVESADKSFDDVQFRSVRKDGQLAGKVVFARRDTTESRFALIPPLPSRLSYHVEVPAGGQLDFEIGVGSFGADALPAPVTFVIEVDGESVFEETFPRRFADRWLRRRVDLSPWSESSVDIAFEMRMRKTAFANADGLANQMLAAWGNPVLGSPRDRAGATRPDLILVSIDCLRADHVGAYGHDKPTTPALDRFAADAFVFENAVSVSSWTLPTHMSMLTGLMPTEHGLRRAQKRFPSTPYLPEILARDGYETMGVVSGLYLSPTFGFDEGFDVYSMLNNEPAENLVDLAATQFLAEPRRPRFLFLHFFDAHWPYKSPGDEYAELAGGLPADIDRLNKIVLERQPPAGANDIADTKALYDAEVAYIDDQLGRFFHALREEGVYDDALIVVTADHGEGFFEHNGWQHSGIIYNEVTRVPLMVKPPNGREQARVAELVSQLGIFPTFLDALGRDIPFEHSSLVALGKGEAPFPERTMSEITWEANETRGPYMMLAVTEGPLKYVATFSGELGDDIFVSELTREELYDLSTDPGETENLLPARAGEIGELRADVRAFIELVQERRATGGEQIIFDQELDRKLRALGYIE